MSKYYCSSEKDASFFISDEFNIRSSLFDKYGKVYPFTNENIGGCLKLVDFDKKTSALTVLSSGDHAFNLIKEGIINVDTFDINRLTEYYALGLKRAMIQRYSYEEFLNIVKLINHQICCPYASDSETDIIRQLILDLSFDMDKKYRLFWLNVINLSDNINGFFASRLLKSECEVITSSNNYLKDEESYNLLKSRIGGANITFKNAKILEVPKRFRNKKYDIVIFSNILDYMNDTFGINWNCKRFNEFGRQVEKICSDDSTIFYHYVFAGSTLVMTDNRPIFTFSSVYLRDLKDMKFEVIKNESFFDGVLVKRIKR